VGAVFVAGAGEFVSARTDDKLIKTTATVAGKISFILDFMFGFD
jgi:hypothetical protein